MTKKQTKELVDHIREMYEAARRDQDAAFAQYANREINAATWAYMDGEAAGRRIACVQILATMGEDL